MENITIIGAGNLGQALAIGLTKSGQYNPSDISLTKRNVKELSHFANSGYKITTDNSVAVEKANMIIVSVGPQDAEELFHSIKDVLNPNKHIIVSTITGVNIDFIENIVGDGIPIIRIMPNTAVAICESMTCLAADEDYSETLGVVKKVFDQLGQTLVVKESLIAKQS